MKEWTQEAVGLSKLGLMQPGIRKDFPLEKNLQLSLDRGIGVSHLDAGRGDSFSKDPGTGMVGGLQGAIRLNQVQSLKGHRQKEQTGDSDMAETLVHTLRCVFTVAQEKDELSV